MRATAWLTRLNGETSTACLRTVPWDPIRVESSRGPVLTIPSTRLQARGSARAREGRRGKEDAHLDGVLSGEEVDDLEGVGNDTNCHLLLSGVPSVHHETRGGEESLLARPSLGLTLLGTWFLPPLDFCTLGFPFATPPRALSNSFPAMHSAPVRPSGNPKNRQRFPLLPLELSASPQLVPPHSCPP